MEILVAEQHHRGSKRYITPRLPQGHFRVFDAPCRRSDASSLSRKNDSLFLWKIVPSCTQDTVNDPLCVKLCAGCIPVRKAQNFCIPFLKIELNLAPFAVAVCLIPVGCGWSDSLSNFSAKLSRESLRYKEALELAQVLGYEIVWKKKEEN